MENNKLVPMPGAERLAELKAEWPQNLGNEDLLNDYRASLMLGSAELTEALRGEILRRLDN